jgi:hypothetical protein
MISPLTRPQRLRKEKSNGAQSTRYKTVVVWATSGNNHPGWLNHRRPLLHGFANSCKKAKPILRPSKLKLSDLFSKKEADQRMASTLRDALVTPADAAVGARKKRKGEKGIRGI